uniref:Uncharacterized protein n=1 Tax=Hyaloperonospora arabidopsidis (strain Emoy2) TaxID=559515 RepID=M4BA41_HYAAE
MSRGDTEIAMATLNQPSLRVRAALLSNMCAEPPSESSLHQNIDFSAQMEGRRRQHFTKSALFESDAMEDVSDPDTPASATSASMDSCSTEVRLDEKRVASAGAFVSAPTGHSTHSEEMVEAGEVDYFPGMFSSRQPTGTPTRSVKASSPLVIDEKTSTRSKDKGREKTTFGDISVESIDSSTDVLLNLLTMPNPRTTDPTGSRDVGGQATNFGSSPAEASSAPSTPLQPFVSSFGDRRPLGTPPVRSKIHPTFAFTSLTPPVPNVAGSTDDFSLKPHYIDRMNSNSFPGETQDHAMVTVNARGNRTAQQTSTAAPSTPDSDAIMETPERYQFVRELSTSSRIEVARRESEYITSRATKEQVEGVMEMELERVDDEFSTPVSRPKGQRKQPASVPVRRNPRRSTRQKY